MTTLNMIEALGVSYKFPQDFSIDGTIYSLLMNPNFGLTMAGYR